MCVCVCVWCRPYVTDPSPLTWVREETVSSRAFQGDIRTEGGIKEDTGRRSGNLPLSLCLDVCVMLSPVCYTLSLCVFLHLFPVCCLSFSFYYDSLCVCGSRESAPGSCCDEVMRRDVVIQQFQPKGHICSLSFALCICLDLSRSLFFGLPFFIALYIEDVLCSFCQCIYHLYCINAHQRKLFWTVDS